jgi:succinoglycan biosynthesis transport protein ExoP
MRLMTGTAIDVVKSTLIVEMRALADDPEKARANVEAMAESYVEVNFDAKKQAHTAAAAAIREEIEETARDLESAERRLLDFKTEHNLVSDRAKEKEQGEMYGSGIAARAAADVQRREIDTKYRALSRWYQRNDFTFPLPLDLAPNANDLYQQIVKKRMEYKGLLSTYREQHPKVQAVKTEIETLRRTFDEEVQTALEGLRRGAEVYSSIGQAHTAGIESDKAKALKENERDWQYTVLQRDVDVKQEIYRALLLKLGEINVTTSIVKNNVRIIERPKAIPIPVRPNWRFNLMLGLVFGLGVAVAGVFFLEYLDKTLKTPDDITRYLGLPVLAIVPLARAELLRAPYEAPQIREGDPGVIPA